MVACPICEGQQVRTHVPTVVALEEYVEREHHTEALSCSPFYRFGAAFQNYAARHMLALADSDAVAFDVSTLFETNRAPMESTFERYGFVSLCDHT